MAIVTRSSTFKVLEVLKDSYGGITAIKIDDENTMNANNNSAGYSETSNTISREDGKYYLFGNNTYLGLYDLEDILENIEEVNELYPGAFYTNTITVTEMEINKDNCILIKKAIASNRGI